MFSRHGFSRILLLQAVVLLIVFQTVANTDAQTARQGAKDPISILQPLQRSQVSLTKATTPDAKTVVVTYAVLAGKAGAIHFDLYRSEASNATTNAILSLEDTNPSDLTAGEHTVSFTPNAGLPPNTAFPYVVVVATSGGQKSAVYFHKFLVGVIAHGFDRWAFANTLSSVSFVSVPPWETAMARSLKSLDRYDDVIAFNWTQTCTLPKPDMAVQAGLRLASEVVAKSALRSQHPGDVVDFHFIGHSRGAVVVAEAIKALAVKDPLLGGSFIEVTLLDPHPANTCFTANCKANELPDLSGPEPANPAPESPDPPNTDPLWASFAKDSRNRPTTAAQIVRIRATHFQNTAADPPVTIPPGVRKVEVWFQHTQASCFNPRALESQMNLWGMVDSPALADQSGQLTQPTEKTNCAEAIGHNQMQGLYQTQVVESGTLNRHPQ